MLYLDEADMFKAAKSQILLYKISKKRPMFIKFQYNYK